MSQIRTLAPSDIPGVAGLFQRTFLERGNPAPASLEAYLADLFLGHPWHDPEIASRVYVSPEGGVRGFIGVLPLHLSFRGKPIRAAVAGSLMVDNPEEIPLAGARLLRAAVSGPQLIITESANRVSQNMWERLGGQALPFESMDWLRIFHPAGVALAIAGERFAPAKLLRPLGSIVDRVARAASADPFRFESKLRGYAVEAADELLLREIPRLAANYAVRPDWDAQSLLWMLAHTRAKARRGPMIRRLVYGKDGEPLGCYLYYGGPREIAWVLQILAGPEAMDAVLDSLLADAFRNGSVGVRGRAHPRLMNALLRQGSMFFHRCSTLVKTADRELLDTIQSGNALVTGIAGEGWTRLIGDTFE